jgi:two-component system NtrC family sensor kinase
MNNAQVRPLEKATLLMVDAVRPVGARLESVLSANGCRVSRAANVAEGLHMLRQAAPQLVLLDAERPEADSLSLCRVLRSQSSRRRPRVIFYASRHSEEAKLAAFSAGADDYLTPPLTDRELLARVQTHLEGARREWALGGRNRELEFLADLGRSLLCARTPEEVARRVAGAVYEGLNASLCAALLFFGPEAPVIYGFNREGVAQGLELVSIRAVRQWLNKSPAALRLETAPTKFFLRDEKHGFECAAPLVLDENSRGALIVGFDRPEDFSETDGKLLETAAQQTALAARVAALHLAAQSSAERLALEVAARTAEIEDQRRLTAAIIDSLPVSLYAIDRDYQIVAWNRQREGGSNGIPRDEAVGRSVFEVLQRQPRQQLEQEFGQVFANGEITRMEEKTSGPDGVEQHWLISKVPMMVNGEGQVSHVITIGENVTTAVNAQRAIARAEKLAAVGRLAAGVVHEINNPLATISACAEALSSRVDEGAFAGTAGAADLCEYLTLIRSEVFRCKGITNGLLDFSRKRAATQHPVQISEVLRSAARLVKHQAHDGIRIKLDLPDDLSMVMGDSSQLQQAVIALATNAVDAMPRGGLLTLAARNVEKAVRVEVADNGSGIAPEHLPRIFDPFFTTKEVGRGTGLGLAVCYGIVTEHAGQLEVESKIGKGTRFTIMLPSLILKLE